MSSPKILIVEDNRIYAENLRANLQANKCEVVEIVAAGEDALAFIQENPVDLILMDIKLQGQLNGIETSKIILHQFDIPVVYLTAFTDQKTINQAKKTEPYGFLDKPVNEVELQRTLEFALYKHRMESKLRKSEERFKQISASAHDGIALINEKGLVNFWNKAAEKIFGFTHEEVLNKNLATLIAPPHYLIEYNNIFDHFFSATSNSEKGETIELLGKTKSGEIINVELSLSRFREARYYHLIAIIRDTSERKRAEQEQLRLSTALKQTGESILITDTEGNIEYVNPAFETITGYKKEEVLGKNPRIFNSRKQTKAFYKKLWSTISSGNVWKGRFVNQKKDGTLYHEEATISPVRNILGEIVNYVAVKRDITAKLELEKKMRQNHNLQIMGLYANLFIHDFNNSLQPIVTESENLLDIIPKATESYAKINTIHRCAKEAASVAKQILIFSKKETSLMTSVCVKTTIEDFLKVIDAMRPPDVNIVLDIDEDCDPILANPTQISQLLVNLCTNALQAMPKKAGTLTISLKQISINAEVADQFSSLREGNYVRLSVSDTGHGIPKENIEKIFEPSFTTKKAGEGFGLGLASVRNIVKNHDGEIIVDSKTNHGTTFHILFPTTAKKAIKAPSQQEKIIGGNEKILLIDDDESIAEMLKISLERLGYVVKSFTSSVAALDKFKNTPFDFDLVITDHKIPVLPGDRLAMEIIKIRPEIPIILSTGYGEKINLDQAAKLGIKEILLKPFTRQQLAQAIRKVLDKKS